MSLAILTVFDSLFNVTDIFESIRKVHYDRQSCAEVSFLQELHYYLWPQFLYPLRNIAMVSSIYMTIVLATERYIAVSHPIISYIAKDRRKWKTMAGYTAAMVLLVIAFMAPLFFEFTVGILYFECSDGYMMDQLNDTEYQQRLQYHLHNNTSVQTHQEAAVLAIQWTDLRTNPNYIAVYKTLFQTLVTGLIPLVSLIVLNYLVYDSIKKRRDEWDFTSEYIFVFIPRYYHSSNSDKYKLTPHSLNLKPI